jgi:uncharacterized protein (DUF1015 family)
VPRFEPFPGLRYDADEVDLAAVTAPPYDVIDGPTRDALASGHSHQVVHLDLPVPDGDKDRYEAACSLLHRWQDEGVLIMDRPSFYVYRMAFTDEEGADRETLGVIGALELSRPGEGGILPHEHTTKKAKSDRLAMLQSCRANLSAVWGLSLADGLSSLCRRSEEPVGDWVDPDGVRHQFWVIDDPDTVAAMAASVSAAPVVIADGHHRYETSLAYRDERRESDGADGGPADLVMAYVVELVDEQLAVRPIHRLISGLPDGFDLVSALSSSFVVGPVQELTDDIGRHQLEEGALGLVSADGVRLLTPRPEAMEGVRDLDSSRLDRALESLPDHDLTFQHGIANVEAAVSSGAAQAGVLLRPATVAQIVDIAHGGERMPPKTTFFYPKLRTGLVLRLLD